MEPSDLGGEFTLDQVRTLWFDGEAADTSDGIVTIRHEADGDGVESMIEKETSSSSRKASIQVTMPGSSIVLRANKVVTSVGDRPDTMEPGDYQLGGTIGQGGMGVVIAAKQASMDRRVAVKMIRGDRQRDEGSRFKFMLEALATGSLEHPNVVPVYELGQDEDGNLFYAMKEVKGMNWRGAMKKRPEKENIETFCQVANAVAYAHSKGILHRDIKSENVMLGDFGEVMLMDWGLAVGMRAGAKAQLLTPENTLAGTPAYMAPEMARGNMADIGPWSDQYLLGALLYEILTGVPPHPGEGVEECLRHAANNAIQETGRSDEWVDVAMRAMHANPVKRYPSVKDFIARVRECQAHGESLDVARLAGEALGRAQKSGEYEQYVRALNGFEQALELWDGNDKARIEGDKARLIYATTALERGDYDLSLSLSEKSDAPNAAELVQKALKGKRERDNRRRLVRWLGLAAGILLLVTAVVAGGAAVLISRQAKAERLAREEAELERSRAEEQRAVADLQRQRAEDALVETERQRNIAETERVRAEEQRAVADSQRQRAEDALVEAEHQRNIAESERARAEEQRAVADSQRQRAEDALVETERQRSIAEKERGIALEQRAVADEQRGRAETALAAAEAARQAEARAMSERLREEQARAEAEALARKAAEDALAAREVVQRMGYLEDNTRWRLSREQAVALRSESATRYAAEVDVTLELVGAPLQFSWIPPGEFVMGSPPRDVLRNPDEHLHEVRITRPFYLSCFELTRGQWRELMGTEEFDNSGMSDFERLAWAWRTLPVPPEEADLPATGIAMREVEELLLPALQKRFGAEFAFRLPTEAEWEWAARAGSTTAFSSGDEVEALKNEGWFEENSAGRLHRVGLAAGNVWNIYDASGNASELTADHYDPNFYLTSEKDDPLCRLDTPMRVVRGGSFVNMARQCRLASRSYAHYANRHPQVGVRLVLEKMEAAERTP